MEKKGFLKVDSIRRTVTRMGRAYAPAISREEYELQMEFVNSMSQSQSLKKSTLNLCSTLLHSDIVDDDFISELESIIQDFKDVPVYENVKDIPDYKK